MKIVLKIPSEIPEKVRKWLYTIGALIILIVATLIIVTILFKRQQSVKNALLPISPLNATYIVEKQSLKLNNGKLENNETIQEIIEDFNNLNDPNYSDQKEAIRNNICELCDKYIKDNNIDLGISKYFTKKEETQ